MILAYFLHEDAKGFVATVREWSPSLYNVQNVITLVTEVLKSDPNNMDLMDALADLYVFCSMLLR